MPQSYKWLLPWAVSLSACTVVNTRARAGDFSTGIIIWRKMPCLQNQNFPWGNAWFCCFPPSLPFTPSHTGTVTSEFFNFVFLRKKLGCWWFLVLFLTSENSMRVHGNATQLQAMLCTNTTAPAALSRQGTPARWQAMAMALWSLEHTQHEVIWWPGCSASRMPSFGPAKTVWACQRRHWHDLYVFMAAD